VSPSPKRGRDVASRPLSGAVARVALVVTVLLVSILTLTHGSFALWNGAAPISATTVVSGTLTATVAEGNVASSTDTSAQFAPSTWSGMLPGESRQAAFTVANTGTAPFELAASLDAAAASSTDVHFAVGVGPCPTAAAALEPISGAPVQVRQTQSASQVVTYCLSVTIDPGIAASAENTTVLSGFTLYLSANQATS
jgi:hypothetical protein